MVAHRLARVQLTLFAILYSIWLLPSTILIRNITLISGAIIGLAIIIAYWHKFNAKQLIPFFAILGIFAWVVARLVIFPTNYSLQYQEFHRIWIRVALASIFAFGFGILISQIKIGYKTILGFNVILAMPAIIFLIKLLLTSLQASINISIPEALTITYSDSNFYIPKIAYVSFCMPSIAASVVSFQYYYQADKKNISRAIPFAFILLSNFLTFESINTKNGMIYGLLIVIFFLMRSVLFSKYSKSSSYGLLAKLFSIFIFLIVGGFHVYQNQSWQSIISDVKVGIQIEKYQNWKNGVNGTLPINEYGRKVYGTNYERTAWVIAGFDLLTKNPIGYGAVENSFGHLAKVKWPESKLHQTHSGWLDLALGIGIPGVALLITAIFFSLKETQAVENNLLASTSFWILTLISIIWTTTELSQKVYIDNIFFWTMFSSGVGIGFLKKLDDL